VGNVEAGGFSNGGRMHSKNLNLSIGGTLDNNGELIGTESAAISCDTLSGKGLISSPQISIKTKLFAYTGTIDCNGKCTITTSSPFDQKMFKRSGGGEFIIIVDKTAKQAVKYLAEEYTITDELLLEVE
jgi:filamentous hemagglutinin